MGSLGARAAAAEKTHECPARTGQGRLITEDRLCGLHEPQHEGPPSHCHRLLPVVVVCCEHLKLSWLLYPWGGAGTGIGDKASDVI